MQYLPSSSHCTLTFCFPHSSLPSFVLSLSSCALSSRQSRDKRVKKRCPVLKPLGCFLPLAVLPMFGCCCLSSNTILLSLAPAFSVAAFFFFFSLLLHLPLLVDFNYYLSLLAVVLSLFVSNLRATMCLLAQPKKRLAAPHRS